MVGASVGFFVGTGVEVGTGVAVGVGTGVAVGSGVTVGVGTGVAVAVGTGVAVGVGVTASVGTVVAVGSGEIVTVGEGLLVDCEQPAVAILTVQRSTGRIRLCKKCLCFFIKEISVSFVSIIYIVYHIDRKHNKVGMFWSTNNI